MTDTPPDTAVPPVCEIKSTAAVVTFIVLAILAMVDAGTYALVGFHVVVEPAMLTVVGQIQGGAQTLAVAAVAYWVGASVGGKTANAALAQLAGAGAPPPADPLAPAAAAPDTVA